MAAAKDAAVPTVMDVGFVVILIDFCCGAALNVTDTVPVPSFKSPLSVDPLETLHVIVTLLAAADAETVAVFPSEPFSTVTD